MMKCLSKKGKNSHHKIKKAGKFQYLNDLKYIFFNVYLIEIFFKNIFDTMGISHNYSKKRFLGLKYSWIMILSNKWLMWRNGSHALPKLETSKALGLT